MSDGRPPVGDRPPPVGGGRPSTGNRRRSAEEANPDLGFGSVVARESRERLLNPDGSFNVRREGLGFWSSMSAYHALLEITWGKFFLLIVLAYASLNALFAAAYVACGPGALVGPEGDPHGGFWNAFFFSVQTFSTIGYGHVSPEGTAANAVVSVEALVGLLGFALATGLLFARFSRPTARIAFSERAVVAPYREGQAFEFRIVNRRKSQIVDLHAQVLFSRMEEDAGRRVRRFYPLRLERDFVTFFPLTWTIVHPIDEASPMRDRSPAELSADEAEFLVLLTGFDETFAQTVHARSSYRADEVVFGAQFSDIFRHGEGAVAVDVSRLSELRRPEDAPLLSDPWQAMPPRTRDG